MYPLWRIARIKEPIYNIVQLTRFPIVFLHIPLIVS